MRELLNEFETMVSKAAVYKDGNKKLIEKINKKDLEHIFNLLYATTGLAGEAGEFSNKIKKVLRDKEGKVSLKTREELISELGDVAWYLEATAQELGSSIDELLIANIKKISGRLERGTIQGDGDNR